MPPLRTPVEDRVPVLVSSGCRPRVPSVLLGAMTASPHLFLGDPGVLLGTILRQDRCSIPVEPRFPLCNPIPPRMPAPLPFSEGLATVPALLAGRVRSFRLNSTWPALCPCWRAALCTGIARDFQRLFSYNLLVSRLNGSTRPYGRPTAAARGSRGGHAVGTAGPLLTKAVPIRPANPKPE